MVGPSLKHGVIQGSARWRNSGISGCSGPHRGDPKAISTLIPDDTGDTAIDFWCPGISWIALVSQQISTAWHLRASGRVAAHIWDFAQHQQSKPWNTCLTRSQHWGYQHHQRPGDRFLYPRFISISYQSFCGSAINVATCPFIRLQRFAQHGMITGTIKIGWISVWFWPENLYDDH